MAYAVEYAASGIGSQLFNVFLLAEIREFAEEAIVAAAGLRGGFAFFKKRTSVKLGYDEITVGGIFLFYQFTPPPSCILIISRLYKKAPQKGEFVVDCMFFGVDCTKASLLREGDHEVVEGVTPSVA